MSADSQKNPRALARGEVNQLLKEAQAALVAYADESPEVNDLLGRIEQALKQDQSADTKLRDQYAGQAMQALLTHPKWGETMLAIDIATTSFNQADKMMEVRAR